MSINNTYPAILDKRLHQIRFMMDDIKVDAMCVSHLPNVRYLTNFSGSFGYLFITQDDLHFVTDDRYEEQVKEELYQLPNLHTHIDRDVWRFLGKSKILGKCKTLGFEADRIAYSDAVEIRNVIRPLKFKPAPNEVEPFTRPKAPEEIGYIKKACDISEKTYEEMLKIIKPGMTERELANELVYTARKLGSEGVPFPISVLSGARTALVHGKPSDKKIKKNEVILLDFGAQVNGFASDITRTFVFGKPTKEQKNIYDIVRKSQLMGMASARPTMTGKILDGYARKVIEDAGYGQYFRHSLGHGIGISVHEMPVLTYREELYDPKDLVIPEDVVMTIEPGIYLPNKFGIRIEDVVHVTRNGTVQLSNAPNELVSIG